MFKNARMTVAAMLAAGVLFTACGGSDSSTATTKAPSATAAASDSSKSETAATEAAKTPPSLAGTSREDLVKYFTESGLTPAISECLADGMLEKFPDLGSLTSLTPEQATAVAELTQKCATGG